MVLFNIKHSNHSVMLRWVLWNNKLQNANKEKIRLCLWVAFNFNWFIISRNYIFKLSWLPQLWLLLQQGSEGYRSRASPSANHTPECKEVIFLFQTLAPVTKHILTPCSSNLADWSVALCLKLLCIPPAKDNSHVDFQNKGKGLGNKARWTKG